MLGPRTITMETALPPETVGAAVRSLLADASWDRLQSKFPKDSVPLLSLVAQLDRELGAAEHRGRAHRVSFQCAPCGAGQGDMLTVDFPARRPAEAATQQPLLQPCFSTRSATATADAPALASSGTAGRTRTTLPNALLDEALSLLGLPMATPDAPPGAPEAAGGLSSPAASLRPPPMKEPRVTASARPRSSPEPRVGGALDRSPIAARTPCGASSSHGAKYKSPLTGSHSGTHFAISSRGLPSPSAPHTPALLSTRSRKRSLTDA